jgi:hypothetical protein
LVFDDDALNAVCQCINSITYAMIDTNETLAEMSKHLTFIGVNVERIVDEIRTLNFAAGRIEDRLSYRPE